MSLVISCACSENGRCPTVILSPALTCCACSSLRGLVFFLVHWTAQEQAIEKQNSYTVSDAKLDEGWQLLNISESMNVVTTRLSQGSVNSKIIVQVETNSYSRANKVNRVQEKLTISS